MSDADRVQWNARYLEPGSRAIPEPTEFMNAWIERLAAVRRPEHEPTPALDLACGTGRHALLLARHGFSVDAWDVSDAAIARLRGAQASLPSSQGARLRAVRVDLDITPIPPESYDLLVVSRFLLRGRLPELAAALRPGGTLLYEHFVAPFHSTAPGVLVTRERTSRHTRIEAPAPGSHASRFQLRPNELLRALETAPAPMHIHHYEEAPAFEETAAPMVRAAATRLR